MVAAIGLVSVVTKETTVAGPFKSTASATSATAHSAPRIASRFARSRVWSGSRATCIFLAGAWQSGGLISLL